MNLQDVSDNSVERMIHINLLFYNICEILLITYLGNEITIASDRLSYCLFESDWTNQPQSTKKCMIIFGEYLKKAHEMEVFKLYPVTLETFTRVYHLQHVDFVEHFL